MLDHFGDDQYRAIGRIVVAASLAEWMVAALASCFGPWTPSDLLKSAGGAMRGLKTVARARPELAVLHDELAAAFAERHRVIHDVPIHQFAEPEEIPVLLVTNLPAFEFRPVPTAGELDELANRLRMLDAKAMMFFPDNVA